MSASNDLQRLCETWWEQLATSTRSEQHKFAEQFLELLDWQEPAPIAMQALAPQLSTVSYVLRGEGQTAIAAHFTTPGSLEPPSSLFERSVDFCPATRVLVDAAKALRVRYCYVTDMFRSYLYDAYTDELLLFADSPTEFRKELSIVLDRAEVEHGSFEEIRRQPRSAVARQLREWRRRSTDTLASQTRLPEETLDLALDRLIVLRFLMDHDILKKPGWRFKQRFEELMTSAGESEPRGVGKQLTSLFHDLWFDWKADIFKPAPELDEALDRDEVSAPLLAEFSLLSKAKFALPTVLESFNYGDAPEKARVRMIPDDDEERLTVLHKQTPESIDTLRLEVDIEDEGYRAVFHWFDRLVHEYGRMEQEFDMMQERSAPMPGDVDLFAWGEQAAARPQAFGERFHYASEKGLTIYYASQRQYRTIRLLLYLHVISRYERNRIRFTRFPQIEQSLHPRPHFTNQDHKRIFNHDTNDEWDAV